MPHHQSRRVDVYALLLVQGLINEQVELDVRAGLPQRLDGVEHFVLDADVLFNAL